MPFGIKFKRTRRYDISTKNIFMVEVQMLDNSFLECTLTADSTGQECLDGIAQKIDLVEIQYFGLRYVTRKLQFRWVDLTKPLKKQLEKYAQTSHSIRSPRLYFGVMFYIANAHKIVDDVARYQYYLQLKNDIVDGRLPLSIDQVIRLAALSLQVDFSDYEYERNAADYFTDNLVFPKNLTKDENILSELMNEVLQMYASLKGYPPVNAEIEYMKEIQLMDGYGVEYYVAKDERNKELYLGTSYVGISARYLDGQPPVFFKWTEVARLSQSKKTFEIDTSKSSVQYTMDSDTAKYLRRMCLLQQKFYKSNKSTLSTSLTDINEFPEAEIPDIQQSVLPRSDIPVDQLNESQTSLTFQDQKSEQDSRSVSVHTDDYNRLSQQSLNMSAQDLNQAQPQVDAHPEGTGNHPTMQHQNQQTTSPSDPSMDPNYASRLAALPAYRPTPDYATAVMRQKMNQAQQPVPSQPQYHDGSHQNMSHDPMYGQSEEDLAYSQQDIRHNMASYRPDGHYNMMQQFGNYTHSDKGLAYSQPDIGHSVANYPPDNQYNLGGAMRNYSHSQTVYTHVFQDQSEYLQYRVNDRPSNLVIQPTYSSPELTSQGIPQGYTQDNILNVNETYAYHYKPPPPYPRASNSTPDLAVQTMKSNVSGSPDLISRKTLGDSAFMNQSKFDQSVENLAELSSVSEQTTAEINASNVSEAQTEPDDCSSDHSNSTFHVKELDSEPDEPFVRAIPQRQSSKSKIQIRFVAPNKAPPPSTSKDVAVHRESFRRMMIARSGSFTPGVLKDESRRVQSQNRSLRVKDRESIEEHIAETNKSPMPPPKPPARQAINRPASKVISILDQVPPAPTPTVTRTSIVNTPPTMALSKLNITASSESPQQPITKTNYQKEALSPSVSAPPTQAVLPPGGSREVVRSQSDTSKAANKLVIKHEKAVSLDSSSERQQLLDKLKLTEPEVPSTISENVSEGKDVLQESDSDSDTGGQPKHPIGPLKLAAMNGLAMSRPMILALRNDETRAPKDERRKMLEAKLSDNLVFKEFEETPKKMADMECTISKLPENSIRNRFRDILPYDSTRVKINPRKDNPSGYINASHVKLSVGNRTWWYIATQAPVDKTVGDFWQMIWEQEVEVIGMLTALAELGRPKCHPYWPQDAGAENKMVLGDFEVTLLFTNDSLCYVTNRIHILHLPSKKERQIWHLQYTDWPDHGCPDDMYGFLGFLDEVDSVQRLAESEEGSGKKSPVVIHCSAGVGRSGVVILTQVMKWCLEHNHDIDLPKALHMIRQQRMYMVQTLGQYNFIHKTLIQYLKNTRLI